MFVCCHPTLSLQVGSVGQDFFYFGGQSRSYFGGQSFSSAFVSMRRTVIMDYIFIFCILRRNEAVNS